MSNSDSRHGLAGLVSRMSAEDFQRLDSEDFQRLRQARSIGDHAVLEGDDRDELECVKCEAVRPSLYAFRSEPCPGVTGEHG